MKIIIALLISCLLISSGFTQDYKKGSKVEIKWNNTWYKGSVVDVKDGKYKVTYEGWTSLWDEWVGTDRVRNLQNTSTGKATSGNSKGNSTADTKTLQSETGVNPSGGKWVATISNGYKGDKLTFTVSADGKRVENVSFVGYWQKRDRMSIEELKNLDPADPFAVTKGIFSAVQQIPKSRMWWEVTGRFITPTTAEGTYRAAYAGGENDTYKLKWTGKKVQ